MLFQRNTTLMNNQIDFSKLQSGTHATDIFAMNFFPNMPALVILEVYPPSNWDTARTELMTA